MTTKRAEGLAAPTAIRVYPQNAWMLEAVVRALALPRALKLAQLKWDEHNRAVDLAALRSKKKGRDAKQRALRWYAFYTWRIVALRNSLDDEEKL